MDEANVGKGSFEPGWRLVESVGGEHFLADNGRFRVFVDSSLHLHPDEQPFHVGDNVRVKFPKCKKVFAPGQYVAFGDVYWRYVPGDCVRIYFRIRQEGAPELVRQLTMRLNRNLIPFRIKVLANPALYSWRRDTSVLYFRPIDFARARAVVKEAYPCFADWTERPHRALKQQTLAAWIAG